MDQAARSHDDVDTAASHRATADGGAGNGAAEPDSKQTLQTVFDAFGEPPEGPYEVGHLTVGSNGQVNVAYPSAAAVAFDFVYRGVPFHAELPSDLEAPLTISAVLGVLPYSAETVVGRHATLDMLALARPARGVLSLEAGGRIHVRFTAPVSRPRTPVSVLATVSCLLVDLRPYLDLLATAGALRPR